MAFKIGFMAEQVGSKPAKSTYAAPQPSAPRKSLVQIYFPHRNMHLTYYNDRFDLHCGDLVYVDGKLEGFRGRVEEVQYNFRIRLADYKRVIAVVDTEVHGEFFLADSHVVTFDPEALPAEKVITWYRAPETEEIEVVSGSDGAAFSLHDLKTMEISGAAAERGNGYYMENRVRYLSLDDDCGYAIVEGSNAYEVRFTYRKGQISDLSCSCYCCGGCKHEFAAMLQLRDLLKQIEENYPEEYRRSGYFAAMDKGTFFSTVVDGGKRGRFTL